MSYMCPKCGGTGKLKKKKCKICSGNGRVNMEVIKSLSKRPKKAVKKVTIKEEGITEEY